MQENGEYYSFEIFEKSAKKCRLRFAKPGG